MSNLKPIKADVAPEVAISELTWDQLLARREAVIALQEELEAELSVVKDEIVARLDEEKINGKIVGDKNISVRTVYSTDKETAKELGAITVSTSERVNTTIIKELFQKGIEIKNLQITKTPLVTEVRKEEK